MLFEFNIRQASAARHTAARMFSQGRRELALKWVHIAKMFYGMAAHSRQVLNWQQANKT